MGHHVIEYDEQCKACKGTGLYFGLAERDGSAVVCRTCGGTGCHHVKIKYDDFNGRKDISKKCERVFEVNPGICIGTGEDCLYRLSDFGGMPYKEWEQGLPFPPKSENRLFTCPAWWYQYADYNKKPYWDDNNRKCGWQSFSSCKHFHEKNGCWDRFDKENN